MGAFNQSTAFEDLTLQRILSSISNVGISCNGKLRALDKRETDLCTENGVKVVAASLGQPLACGVPRMRPAACLHHAER